MIIEKTPLRTVEKYFTGPTSLLLISNFWYWQNTSPTTDPGSYSSSELQPESCYEESM